MGWKAKCVSLYKAYDQLQNTQFGMCRGFQLVLGYGRDKNLKDMLISASWVLASPTPRTLMVRCY